ncbi:MAG: winged helix-turn-helix transcriptional regulator [Solirubrobacteraceae bacterium]
MLLRVLGKDYDRQDCALAKALETIGERWTLLIVRDAFFGVRRFNDFQVHLDVPKAVLSARLAGLVREGVMERRPDPDHTGRHLYELTAAGRELWPVLYSLLVWGRNHRYPNARVFRHAGCGTVIDDAGACPKCRVTPAPQDLVMELQRGRGKLRDDPVARALNAPHRLLEAIDLAASSQTPPRVESPMALNSGVTTPVASTTSRDAPTGKS